MPSTKPVPKWMVNILLTTLNEVWPEAKMDNSKQYLIPRHVLEEFKGNFMSTMSQKLDKTLCIAEPPPVTHDETKDIAIKNKDPIQPTLTMLLPNIKWTQYSYYNHMYSLKKLGKLVFIDLETTGLNIMNDRICQIAIILVNHSQSDGQIVEMWQKTVCPGIPISEEATKIHGIKNDYAKQCKKLSAYTDIITRYLTGATVVGFNSILFDLPLLTNEFKRIDKNFKGFRIKNHLDLAQLYWKLSKMTLSSAYRFYTGGILTNSHSAKRDALACLEILPHALKVHNLPMEDEDLTTYKREKPKLNKGSRDYTVIIA